MSNGEFRLFVLVDSFNVRLGLLASGEFYHYIMCDIICPLRGRTSVYCYCKNV